MRAMRMHTRQHKLTMGVAAMAATLALVGCNNKTDEAAAPASAPSAAPANVTAPMPDVGRLALVATTASGFGSTAGEAVAEARAVQAGRYAGTPFRCNADLSGKALDEHCRLDRASHDFLGQAVTSLNLSARAYTRILRIARTIADLENTPHLTVPHLAEAVNCRTLDRADN